MITVLDPLDLFCATQHRCGEAQTTRDWPEPAPDSVAASCITMCLAVSPRTQVRRTALVKKNNVYGSIQAFPTIKPAKLHSTEHSALGGRWFCDPYVTSVTAVTVVVLSVCTRSHLPTVALFYRGDCSRTEQRGAVVDKTRAVYGRESNHKSQQICVEDERSTLRKLFERAAHVMEPAEPQQQRDC